MSVVRHPNASPANGRGVGAALAMPRLVATVTLPTAVGPFETHAFECASGFVYLALTRGHVRDGTGVLARLHSECLTGDALGSLRCDCGVQLRLSLRMIAAEGRGDRKSVV
jgi:GTP cyclohydrolase II